MKRVLLFVVGLCLLGGAIDSSLGPFSLLLAHLRGGAPPITDADRSVLTTDVVFALVLLLFAVWAIGAAIRARAKDGSSDLLNRSN